MRARDLMRRLGEPVRLEDELREVTRRFESGDAEALPVLDASGRLVGVILPEAVQKKGRGAARKAGLGAKRQPLHELKAEDVMHRSPRTIGGEVTLGEAAGAMLEEGIRHLPVVDADEGLVGMLSERDLRTKLGTDLGDWYRGAQLDSSVEGAMTFDPISVRRGTPLARVLDTFEDEKVGALPVLDDDDRLVGIISYVDVLDWLRRNLEHAEAIAPTH